MQDVELKKVPNDKYIKFKDCLADIFWRRGGASEYLDGALIIYDEGFSDFMAAHLTANVHGLAPETLDQILAMNRTKRLSWLKWK